MGPKKFAIILDNPQANYYAGQTISGRTEFELTDNLKLRAVFVYFAGKADVHWSEKHGNTTYYYHSAETYFETKTVIFGQATGKEATILKPGKHSYPFQFELPQKIPSSFESVTGNVRYIIKATLDRPWAFDNHCKKFFTVTRLLDLNDYPQAMAGAGNQTEKTLCCLCCKSPPIKATVQLTRCGYVAGEFIHFTGEIDNQTKREMTCSKAALYMQVNYHSRTKSRQIATHITELRHPSIPAGGKDSWVGKLGIPPVPPSLLEGCSIIDIKYYLSLIVDPSGPGFDLHCPVEVTIGSIPFRSVAQEHGYNIPALPTEPAPDAPSGIYSDTTAGVDPNIGMPEIHHTLAADCSMVSNTVICTIFHRAPSGIYMDTTAGADPNIAFPPMRESAFGTVNTKEDGDKHTFGDDKYAPMYTYYDWNKPGTS